MLSLDVATSTGWAYWIDGKLKSIGCFKCEEPIDMVNNLRILQENKQINFIIYERIPMVNNVDTFRFLCHMESAVEIFASIGEIPIDKINVMTWKLHALGKGDATKEEVRDFVEYKFLKNKKFDKDLEQDIYDAIGIGYGYLLCKFS